MTRLGVLCPKPSQEARARLIDAVHAIEDYFINIASDTIEKVIIDLKH